MRRIYKVWHASKSRLRPEYVDTFWYEHQASSAVREWNKTSKGVYFMTEEWEN